MIIDNVNNSLKDDLKEEIKKGSEVAVVAEYFSIYAYQELKKQLNNVENLKFLFTSDAFLKNNVKTIKEFYIPKKLRERNIYGTKYEIKLKNDLNQKSISKECADWINRKVIFKSNNTNDNIQGFILVDDKAYYPVDSFTTTDLGCTKGDKLYQMINKYDSLDAERFKNIFNNMWCKEEDFSNVTDNVIEAISEAYKENSPEYIYYYTLYNIFKKYLEDTSEDNMPNDATGFRNSKVWNMLYNFQKDAVLGIISKLEKFNGCILADSVGLGKTFTALSVIKYYENRNKSVLVLCPKKLSENWNTYKSNYKNNPIAEDRMNYDVLYHTDLSRKNGESNGIKLEQIIWGNYDLVVIDESHNFRNGGEISGKDKRENRYLTLMNKVIRKGVKTKVLMLSATPVNNKFSDLKNQIALAYEGDAELLENQLNTTKRIDEIFRQAQREYNSWSKLPKNKRTTDNLLNKLDFDFFELLDSVTIARSRKHIRKYYDTKEIGDFPNRLSPISKRPALTDIENAINYKEIYEQLNNLNLSIYVPSAYIQPSAVNKYKELTHNKDEALTQLGREEGIRRLTSINLLKRLESSVNSFSLTINRIYEKITEVIDKINTYERTRSSIDIEDNIADKDFDLDDINTDYFSVGKKVKLSLADMDYKLWKDHLLKDKQELELLKEFIKDITPEHDVKLQSLYKLIDEKIKKPINDNNKKIIIFTAFSDTADYLYDNVSKYVKEKHNLETAEITGSIDGKSTIPRLKNDLNTVLTLFSPISKDKEAIMPDNNNEIDILIATDCISEGQNLQDCDYLINYDIHWNPVRIIQRFGRIDRIGSKNKQIQLVNYWPDVDLDEYINLKSRVENRMKAVIMSSTGDDDLINQEEKGDLDYRKNQLQRLQKEVVDLEDMNNGISITDLGLNEYKMDLTEYMKQGIDFDKTPKGIYSVVKENENCNKGIIFVLKNIDDNINKDKRNRIHPYYMVYISDNSDIIVDYLKPKELLDMLKILSAGRNEPYKDLCEQFNRETKDGRDMKEISKLLDEAIKSIIDVKEESDINSLFSAGGTTALIADIKGMEDFELISFFVVR